MNLERRRFGWPPACRQETDSAGNFAGRRRMCAGCRIFPGHPSPRPVRASGEATASVMVRYENFDHIDDFAELEAIETELWGLEETNPDEAKKALLRLYKRMWKLRPEIGRAHV